MAGTMIQFGSLQFTVHTVIVCARTELQGTHRECITTLLNVRHACKPADEFTYVCICYRDIDECKLTVWQEASARVAANITNGGMRCWESSVYILTVGLDSWVPIAVDTQTKTEHQQHQSQLVSRHFSMQWAINPGGQWPRHITSNIPHQSGEQSNNHNANNSKQPSMQWTQQRFKQTMAYEGRKWHAWHMAGVTSCVFGSGCHGCTLCDT
jgi:hypothetical protein